MGYYSIEQRMNGQLPAARGAEVRPLIIGDVSAVAADLSPINREECGALTPISPEMVLLHMAQMSECYTVTLADGRYAGMFGIVPEKNIPNTAAIWMVTTPAISEIAMGFIRGSKVWIQQFNERFPLLYCNVYSKNAFTRRWLKIMGFVEGQYKAGHGRNGEDFIEYLRII